MPHRGVLRKLVEDNPEASVADLRTAFLEFVTKPENREILHLISPEALDDIGSDIARLMRGKLPN